MTGTSWNMGNEKNIDNACKVLGFLHLIDKETIYLHY